MNTLTRVEKEQIKMKRREIKSKILQYQKANDDIFHLWAYKKSFDEEYLRNQAKLNLSEIQKLENQYDALGTRRG